MAQDIAASLIYGCNKWSLEEEGKLLITVPAWILTSNREQVFCHYCCVCIPDATAISTKLFHLSKELSWTYSSLLQVTDTVQTTSAHERRASPGCASPEATRVLLRVCERKVSPSLCTLMSRFKQIWLTKHRQTCHGPWCTYLLIYLFESHPHTTGRCGFHLEFCSEWVPVTDALAGRRTHTPAVCWFWKYGWHACTRTRAQHSNAHTHHRLSGACLPSSLHCACTEIPLHLRLVI